MSRAVIIYVLVLPLAVLMGFMLATPTDTDSFAVFLIVASVLALPIILRHHHLLVALTWNASLIVFFMPGQPSLSLLMTIISLTVALIDRTMGKRNRFVWVPSISFPLLAISLVVLVTAELTGGIGGRVFGSETWGAKRYLGVFSSILGYFALTSQRIPKEKAILYTAAFFLGGVTSVVSDLAYMAGPQFYFVFLLIPSDPAALQAVTADTLMRLSGVAFGCNWGTHFLLARYGIRGILDLHSPWRLFVLLACLAGSLLGGYRGLVILVALILVSQFLVEGVYKTTLGPVIIFASLMLAAGTIAFVDRMPLAVQRALSFFPIERIDPMARQDALGTLDWRLSMWRIVIPEIPKYILVGKGYSFSSTDYQLTIEAMRHGMYQSYEDTLVSGNYHNGILTLLIPFGIFGFGAFLWFAGAGLWVLGRNLRYGDPDLKSINTFLLALFAARLFFYLTFYGQFDLDFVQFTGALGFSAALNGGVRSPARSETRVVPIGGLVPVTS